MRLLYSSPRPYCNISGKIICVGVITVSLSHVQGMSGQARECVPGLCKSIYKGAVLGLDVEEDVVDHVAAM